MKFRYTMKGRMALTTVTIATGLVLTVAGCGGGGDDDNKSSDTESSSTPSKDNGSDDDKQESEAPAAESALAEVKAGGLTLKVTSAARDGGGFVTVEGTVTNGTGKPWVGAEWRGDESELVKNGGSIAGASLIDQTGKKKYLVLRDTEGRCLCTKFTGGVQTGATTDWFAQFPAPPEGTTQVDFQVGSMPPATIELSEGE
ncbi:hypothetical protein Sipo8835_01860 [Streptomyces ipomoeae]|uniref:Uncharacterized protein n=4 Tax=Streptomyces ipomoeae TaxID=103232 RepID=A0A540P2B5_9ACTN|nr:hypothetical protein [Streptomyces ipomoeae]EKX65566.1 putative lipoprotein [Streptomyces ipomoeae 91-03]MDX2934019.1 hypothetical protein [Streptomyces ipomoeae]TQE17003.1 hypothetical protein SipoB123_38885 [Streptomyces ipomoeae]TQE38668.1 hypothetical protein Sipo7851_06190 [Streptomyces ipomoeae]TQE39611.1 hypothetical protein Sipo8835_01860 [Streptomyces ipomoeae]